jgi:hypothetical protein
LLAATKHSDFYKVDPQTYTEHVNTSAGCDKGLELQKQEEQKTDEEQMKRKRDETQKEPKVYLTNINDINITSGNWSTQHLANQRSEFTNAIL